jgi:hypothetical protein
MSEILKVAAFDMNGDDGLVKPRLDVTDVPTQDSGALITAGGVYDAIDALGSSSLPPSEDASVGFVSADGVVPVVIPDWVASMYVTAQYSTGTAAVLKMALGDGTSEISVSADPDDPTDMTGYAGAAVRFTITGPSGAVEASFGIRLNR